MPVGRARRRQELITEVDYLPIFQHPGEPDGTLHGHVAGGIRALASRRGDSDPPAAYALLFYAHAPKRELRPRLWVGLDPQVIGVLVTCDFACSAALATEALTPAYCAAHGLPAFDASWTLIAVAAAAHARVGEHLVLAAAQAAVAQGATALVHVAGASCGVFERLGFACHALGPGRVVCYARAENLPPREGKT